MAKGSRDDPPAKQSPQDRRPPPHHSRGVNSARTPAQGRIMDRILERKSYLGDRDKDKDSEYSGVTYNFVIFSVDYDDVND